MECEGLVTKVDTCKGYFEVDNKFKIYLSLLKAYDKSVNFPAILSKVKLKHLHKYASIFIACKTTVFEGSFNVDYEPNFLTCLINNNKLGASDLIIIDNILNMLEENFKFKNNELQELVSEALFEKVVKIVNNEPEVNKKCNQCLNNIITHVEVITISSCRYVEIQSDKFEEFPTWSFGVHSKSKEGSVLFGFVFIHPLYGFLMIKDAFHKMAFIVTNIDANINSIENCYVILKDYKIFTEIFKDRKVPNLEYLIVDYKDIILVYTLGRKEVVLHTSEPLEIFANKEEFILYRKSMICLGLNKKTEIYLEVYLVNNGNKIFLTLPSEYTTIILRLKEGNKYNLYHNNPLKEICNPLFMSVDKLKNFKLEDKQAYFEELGTAVYPNPDTNKIIPITEYKEHLLKNPGLFSFEAIIDCRGFVSNLYPQDMKKSHLYGFTTPGTQTHTVTFSDGRNNCHENVVMYLSNWINRLMPLGLIPEMRVIVKHVIIKSNYIKPTVFTSFEIVDYEPQVPFQTTNLFENHEFEWGPHFFLSQGNKIPHGVIVCSKIQNIRIVEVTMNKRCKKCNIILEAPGSCTYCRSEMEKVEFKLIIYTSDQFGLSRVIVKNPNFLRLVLDIQEKQFFVWWKTFENVGEYSFNVFETNNDQYDSNIYEQNVFRSMLTQLIKLFNNTLNDGFEIKCRKVYSKPKNNNQFVCPVWYYIDGRKV